MGKYGRLLTELEQPIPEPDAKSGVMPEYWQALTESEIKAMVDLEIDWVWEQFFGRGVRTLISGKEKAGKSVFLTLCLRAISRGEEYIGYKTKPTNLLLVTEEPLTKWRDRLIDFEIEENRLFIVSQPFLGIATDREWEQFIELQTKYCLEHEIGIVIFDTIGDFWANADTNSDTEALRAMKPLLRFIRNKIGYVLIHHQNKSGVSTGSYRIRANTDIVVDFNQLRIKDNEGHWVDDDQDTRREIKMKTRFMNENPPALLIDFDQYDLSYTLIGEKPVAILQGKMDKVLAIIEAVPEGLSRSQIMEIFDRDYPERLAKPTANRILKNLLDFDKIFTKDPLAKSPIYCPMDSHKDAGTLLESMALKKPSFEAELSTQSPKNDPVSRSEEVSAEDILRQL